MLAVAVSAAGSTFWARRIAKLGVGPPPLDRKTLSIESLATAIDAMDDPQMRHRAAVLGAAIREEDGIAAAVRVIESIDVRLIYD